MVTSGEKEGAAAGRCIGQHERIAATKGKMPEWFQLSKTGDILDLVETSEDNCGPPRAVGSE